MVCSISSIVSISYKLAHNISIDIYLPVTIFAKYIIDKGSYQEKDIKPYKSISKYRESHRQWTRCLMKPFNEKEIQIVNV